MCTLKTPYPVCGVNRRSKGDSMAWLVQEESTNGSKFPKSISFREPHFRVWIWFQF